MADDLLRKTEVETAAGGRRRAGPRIGLALGAGAARGWAHIGALHELKAMGLFPTSSSARRSGPWSAVASPPAGSTSWSLSPARSTGGGCSACSTSPSAAPA